MGSIEKKFIIFGLLQLLSMFQLNFLRILDVRGDRIVRSYTKQYNH